MVIYDNNTKIVNRVIDSQNKLIIEKIEVGKKVKTSTAYDLPIRLAVAILKDPHGNINFEIPVSGDLNDPSYKVGKVIWSVLKNLIVKAATAPFKLLSAAVGAHEEDLKEIKFEYLSDSLSSRQQNNLDFLARVLRMKPELKIELTYLPSVQDEKELYAVFEAKKRYILKMDSLDTKIPTRNQLLEIEALSINDSLFVAYLNKLLLFEENLTNLDKCKRLIGRRYMEQRIRELTERRRENITNFLTLQKELPADSFSFTDQENRKSNGLPYLKCM